ncbi:MAG: hypothetical protein WAV90_00910 [Gordonia amarae]
MRLHCELAVDRRCVFAGVFVDADSLAEDITARAAKFADHTVAAGALAKDIRDGFGVVDLRLTPPQMTVSVRRV